MLSASELDEVVLREVASVDAVDVHTHLLPPTHGQLLLYGVDELLTYHYLVAELFMVLPLDSDDDAVSDALTPPTADEFFAWPKPRQAALVFEELFVRRTPLSEACRGVVTTLHLLGLGAQLERAVARGVARERRLDELREWFAAVDKEEYLELVFTKAKLKYAVMTNVPFAPEEATHFLQESPPPISPRLKTALRVDPLLAGDWPAVSAALAAASPPLAPTLDGCYRYVCAWVDRIQPLYLMASTPSGFRYEKSSPAAAPPSPAAPPSAAALLEQVLLRVAVERKLPLAIKVGAVRGMNAALRTGGDGVEVADLRFLRNLCLAYPQVKLLVTVLSTENQHELCVLARKFGNLHVYGCWWFCNNPSIIERTTRMRLEMLGTAFTAQHSDARVLDQLLYKWRHSRAAIGPVLSSQYAKLLEAGWPLTEADIKRDVALLFGGAFEAFMAK